MIFIHSAPFPHWYAYDFWGECVPCPNDSSIELIRICIDACVDLYVLVWIAVSCTLNFRVNLTGPRIWLRVSMLCDQ